MSRRNVGISELFRATVKAVWECENVHEGHVQLVITRGMQKGSFKVRARLCDTSDGRIAGVRVQVEGQYPTAQSETFEGFLFGLVVKLDNEASRQLPIEQPQGM